MKALRSLSWSAPLALLLALAAPACLTPSASPAGATPGAAAAASSGAPAAPTSDPTDYYDPTWSDASGNEGKGGVRLISKPGRKSLPLREADFDRTRRGDDSLKKHESWMLFYGKEKQSLSLEWEWVTKSEDKYWGLKWAGAGVAFNQSWAAIDATDARYLVVWTRCSHPDAAVDLKVGLHSTSKVKGAEDTGFVSLRQFSEGKKLRGQWTRAVIPLSAFPGLEKVDLKTLQTVRFDVDGEYPENQRVSVLIDNVHLSDLDMVTPVENLGYVIANGELVLLWDKRPGEKILKFAVLDGDKEVATVPADKREARLPLASVKSASVSVLAVGATERSSKETVNVTRFAIPDGGKLAAPAKQAVTVTVDKALLHEVSPYILGSNFASAEAIKETGITSNRWGGNATTKYNWQGDLSSSASDWFFLNQHSKPPGTPETEKSYYTFIKDTLSSGADVNFTIPTSDWIAKPHPDKGGRYCSFPTKVYPKQDKTDGQGCGNGLLEGGKEKIWGNDPNLSMVKNSPEFQKGLVENIKKLFGGAAGKGVKFYTLDNETGLWNSTHRDTHPKGTSAEDQADRHERYAAMIKSVDPDAKVIGFASWGVMDLAGSNVDYTPPGPDGYKHYGDFKNPADRWSERKKHGDKSQLVYLLERFKEFEKKHGKRLIDVIDIHWYPELYAKNQKGETKRLADVSEADPLIVKKQFAALHEWYDAAFAPDGKDIDSWTANPDNKKMLWDPYHPVIPALKKLIESTYPGTKLAINEFHSGGNENYYGAVVRAALYGIFMQEDLYMSENWSQVDKGKSLYYAQKLYGNYDGKGSRVKGRFVKSSSSAAELMSFAVRDGKRVYVVLVNQSAEKAADTSVKLPEAVQGADAYLLQESAGLRLYSSKLKAAGSEVKVEVPPYSAVLLVMQ